MKDLLPGTVILLAIEVRGTVRRRPAVVLFAPGDEQIVVAPITSQPVQTPFDVEVIAWQEAGLLLPGTVRPQRPAALDRSRVERELGVLARTDWARVRAMVHHIWSSI